MLIHDLRCVTVSQGDLVVSALITAGVSNAIAAGISPPVPSSPGTINLILIIDAALAPGALVNLVITATEAKTAMLQAMGLLLPTGEPITGTSTDALAIACTERGARWEYGVPITPVGALVVAWRRRWFMSERCRILLLALLIDALWGDPPNRYHPVAWMGRGIAWLRRHAPRQGNARLLAFGACISPGGALVVGSLGALSDQGLRWLPDPVSVLIEALAPLPLAIVVAGAHVHDTRLVATTLDAVVIARPVSTQQLCLDAGYVGETTSGPSVFGPRATTRGRCGQCPESRPHEDAPPLGRGAPPLLAQSLPPSPRALGEAQRDLSGLPPIGLYPHLLSTV